MHKLLEVDGAITVAIKDIKDLASFFWGALYSVVLESFGELVDIKSTTFIRVHDLELSLQTNKSLYTTLEQLFLKSIQLNFILLLDSHSCQWLGILLFLLGVFHMVVVLVAYV